MTEFTTADIPNQTGKTAIVTGATGGLGYETARMLAGAGAKVILAGRNAEKGGDALRRIRALHPKADIAFESVDLGNLASIAAFGVRMNGQLTQLDLLVNNAGVMTPPTRKTTSDGFELQFGTNHLGHFALTGQLLPLLIAAHGARVVTISSGAAHLGRIDFDNLQSEQAYRPMRSYGASKLANLLFSREFQRRSDVNGWGIVNANAHPGYARTDLIANGPGTMTGIAAIGTSLMERFLSQNAADGALPTVKAATAPDVRPLDYFGPDGFMQMKGAPAIVQPPRRAKDDAVAKRLWEASEQLTGVRYGAQAVPA
ncbi:MAG: NADP-dependent 3-hydroxy acid dehydrogenase YdfG [Devosia sp.]|uniref:oxidoreductase n=1 Tax=Devosia sp. TaxID=1871048 RepID=UPI0026331AA9|nr:oxidoreductase [Devosia sp.]MDB5589386.1 NADP-dependent 3-hydroxy acid dehydrogenase YdfG [Devosia sp.]